MRVIREDLGYAYNPDWHWDVDDLQGVYLDHPRHALFVAVDDASGELLARRPCGRARAHLPAQPRLAGGALRPRADGGVCRVYVGRAHRRRGVARALVDAGRRFVVRDGGYATLSLHTDPRAPGAEPLWRAMPTTLVYATGAAAKAGPRPRRLMPTLYLSCARTTRPDHRVA